MGYPQKYNVRPCNLPKGQEVVLAYIEKLNRLMGWELKGRDKKKGVKEFGIPSTLTARGKFYFDGTDLKRAIFFEYNNYEHYSDPDKRAADQEKKRALDLFLKQQRARGQYVVYNAIEDKLTIEILGHRKEGGIDAV